MSVLYATVLVVATFIWGYMFYKKDYHPQPFKVIAQIFGIGLFAMIPVFAYKYIYQNYLPMLAEYQIFRPLLDSSILSGLFYFLINLILLSVVLFTLSGFLSLIATIFKHETIKNIRRAIKDEELSFVTISVMIGILIYLESLAEKILGITIIQTIIGTILFLTIIEEYIKHLMVRFVDDKKLKDIDDAITLSIMVGLAFALMETLIYAISSGDLSLIVYRAFLSIPIHLVASGIFGYYYGLAHFAKPLTKKTVGEKTYRFNIKWLHKILTLKRSTVYDEEKMVEGLGLAVLFHATCNILFELNLAFLVVPIIVIGLMLITYFYKESHVLYKLLRAH
ncbi:PrsW family intramembrane metalloprotease [Patescibacteria group bacterium]|nr:PrsW family intramembrane metalloprotease [Patescibacteria group bacterium]MBU1935322.1 PrsW family intramembrane metalloprotease [Patescibacteria group bacterium]